MQLVPFILSHYPRDCHPDEILPLGSAGGFSGAAFWKIATQRGPLCLRRWPKEHPSPQRIDFIHRLLQHVFNEGFTQVPVPIALHIDSTLTHFQYQGHFWELAPWMPGTADYQQSQSNEKLQAAMHALANFHQAAVNFTDGSIECSKPVTVQQRLEQIDIWIRSDIERLERHTAPPPHLTLAELPRWKDRIIDYAKQHSDSVRQSLNAVVECRVPLQACIRDIWNQHILYQGNQVSGVVDFGAARIDTVVADLTRLLGSLAAHDKSKWNFGLEAYESLRPLSDQERSLVCSFDQSAILLAGLNWMRWIYLENRNFSDKTAVAFRLEQILSRLETSGREIR